MKSKINNDPMPSEKRPSEKKAAPRPFKAWVLRNGNLAYNLAQTKRCGASTRAGGKCLQPAMANGRCRLHGGLSTGAKTPEGKARQQASVTQHGKYTQASKQHNREISQLIKACNRLMREGLGP